MILRQPLAIRPLALLTLAVVGAHLLLLDQTRLLQAPLLGADLVLGGNEEGTPRFGEAEGLVERDVGHRRFTVRGLSRGRRGGEQGQREPA